VGGGAAVSSPKVAVVNSGDVGRSAEHSRYIIALEHWRPKGDRTSIFNKNTRQRQISGQKLKNGLDTKTHWPTDFWSKSDSDSDSDSD
jgi:hypothetical protein